MALGALFTAVAGKVGRTYAGTASRTDGARRARRGTRATLEAEEFEITGHIVR